jgi:signal transduction histidine kinase
MGPTSLGVSQPTDLAIAQSRLERLHEATSQFHGCTTRAEAYDVILGTGVDVLGFDWCCLAEAADDMFELVAVSDGAPVTVGERHLGTDEGLAGEAYQTGTPVRADDARADDAAEPVDDAITSVLSVPIEDWGVFQCFTAERDAFDDADLQVVELLLAHAAEAFRRIENQAELRRQNERLDEFTSVVSHDLRSPLSVARGRLELYRESGDEEDLAAAEAAIDRIETRLEALLSLARQGRTVGDRSEVAVADAAEAAWENVDAHVPISIDAGSTVWADRTRLVQLLENLFRNSVEHGSTSPGSQARQDAQEQSSTSREVDADDAAEHGSMDHGPPTRQDAAGHDSSAVTITVGDTDEGFYVADDGPGIPPGDREDVFELGHTTRQDGTGFGLAIVQTIAEAHGWTVTAGESAAGGARFEVRTA